MKKDSKLLTALFAGAAAGFLAAFLLAPDKGKNSRKKIGSLAGNMLKKKSKDEPYDGADLGI